MSSVLNRTIFLSERVAIGSFEHVIPVVLSLVFCVVLIKYSNEKFSKAKQNLVFRGLTIFVSGTVLLFHMYHIFQGNYSLTTDLPLYLCSLLALIIPIFGYYRKYWMYEILVFWIIAGTSQGVITPDIAVGFPAFDYFRYWVVHLGLPTIIFYATFVFKMKPKLKSVFKSFLALQGYLLLMFVANHLLNANYFYLNKKPEAASLLDFLGDWPYYIVTGQLIIIPFFLLIYLPFYFEEKRVRQ